MCYNEKNKKIESLREVALKMASDIGIDIEIKENPTEGFLEYIIEWLGKKSGKTNNSEFDDNGNEIIDKQSYVKENPVKKAENTQASSTSPC